MRDAPTSIHLQSLIAFHLDIMDSFLFYSLFFRNQSQEASSLNFLGIGIDEYAVVTLLAVQALALLHNDENATDSYGED